MSCHHRYYAHGCDWPYPAVDWYDAYGCRPRHYRDDVVLVRGDDLEEVVERPPRRRGPSSGRRWRDESDESPEPVTAASLQSRAEALRVELSRIEQDLRSLAGSPTRPTET
jgi:hypothetical protein